MKKLTSATLQDIEAWIEIVKKEKHSKIKYFLNRFAIPIMTFTKTSEWLKILYFLRKQEIEKLSFFDKLKMAKK